MQNIICFPFVKVVIFSEIEDQFIGIFLQKFSGLFLFRNSLGNFPWALSLCHPLPPQVTCMTTYLHL